LNGNYFEGELAKTDSSLSIFFYSSYAFLNLTNSAPIPTIGMRA